MIIQDKAYPHPVLTPFRDDVRPNTFGFSVVVSPDADNYYLEFEFQYSNPTIIELIEGGSATHSVHVECRRNFFREIYDFQQRESRLVIPASSLVGRVEVSGFVISRSLIDPYRIEGAHPDYGDSAFRVGKGDVLAASMTCVFDAYTDYDPLRRISSILTIQKSEEFDEGPMALDSTDNRLVVTLSRHDYERYASLKADPALGSLLANQVEVDPHF